MSKELWFAEYERLVSQYIDDGLDEDAAHQKAEDRAYDSMINRAADHADHLRKRAREG